MSRWLCKIYQFSDLEKQRKRLKKFEVQKVTFEIEHLEEQVLIGNAEQEFKEHISEQDDPAIRKILKE